jgi:hypothetical protein
MQELLGEASLAIAPPHRRNPLICRTSGVHVWVAKSGTVSSLGAGWWGSQSGLLPPSYHQKQTLSDLCNEGPPAEPVELGPSRSRDAKPVVSPKLVYGPRRCWLAESGSLPRGELDAGPLARQPYLNMSARLAPRNRFATSDTAGNREGILSGGHHMPCFRHTQQEDMATITHRRLDTHSET